MPNELLSAPLGRFGAEQLFFALATVARFGRSGEIAQPFIDHILRPGFVVSLGQSGQVIIDHVLKQTPQLKA